jgi:hypothetical protein
MKSHFTIRVVVLRVLYGLKFIENYLGVRAVKIEYISGLVMLSFDIA